MRALVVNSLLLVCGGLSPAASLAQAGFTEVGREAGLRHEFRTFGKEAPSSAVISAGVAVGDIDADGLPDLFFDVGGGSGATALYRNRGDGTFEEVADAWGVAFRDVSLAAPLFADVDGDGRDDLLVGSRFSWAVRVFRNVGDGFAEVTMAAGIDPGAPTFSIAAGDYDRDGDLDLYTSHWGTFRRPNSLWNNDGTGVFTSADTAAGLYGAFGPIDYDLTANFADVDGDDWPDLLVAADFGNTLMWRNRGDGTFAFAPETLFTDENGMGSALGDFDGDGDLDWYVSSVFDGDGVAEGDWGTTGGRLYVNDGAGVFDELPDAGGAVDGGWGWGASFGDLDGDGALDLFTVNGWPRGDGQFAADSSRLFLGDLGAGPGAPHFVDHAAALGIVDTAEGRGVSLLDYDGDGDLDVLVANYGGPARLFRNDLPGADRTVRVRPRRPIATDLGARVEVFAGGRTQTRWVRVGSNYASQNAPELVFGLGEAARADSVVATWPDGAVARWRAVEAGAVLTLGPGVSSSVSVDVPTLSEWQVAPNPVPRGSSVAVTVPVGGEVALYDLLGRRRAGLVLAGGQEGAYVYRLGAGSAPPPGAYVLRRPCSETGLGMKSHLLIFR